MSRWSKYSKLELKTFVLGVCECNNVLVRPMLIYDTRSLQTTRSFSRAHVMEKDHYAALGVAKGATQQDIKNAYYRLSKIHHPDKNKGCKNSAKLFRVATEAYEVLGNYRTRRLYDKGIGIISKKSSQNDEMAPIVEEDDAQTKFYKQHARRSERPHVSGRSTIYDFDEWASKTITESFQKKQELKREKEIDISSRNQLKVSSHAINLLLKMSVLLAAVLTIIISTESKYSSTQTNSSDIKE